MGKKFLSAVLCAAILAAAAPTAALSASADTAEDYGLAERTSDGVILHAFNWSFNTIKDNLPAIAEAGYTTVQTSPVQAPKDFGNYDNTFDQWWKLYQPLGFSVAEKNSWLGTKAELTELCTEADKYGIKIICDIVSNHLASGSTKNSVAASVEEYEPEIYNNQEKYIHQYGKEVNDSSILAVTQGTLSGLPDLNTSEEFVQERVISLLEECIDCGVDGFRFDAAKHIETPDDKNDKGDYSSEFWPNVIGTASDYAESKGVEIYCYGEVLNTPGTGRDVKAYTQYIDLIDNKAGDFTLYGVVHKNVGNIMTGQAYTYDDSPSNYVIWAESHDTYMGDSGATSLKNTANVSNENIAKAWAIVASRSDSTALYLARPNVIMGKAGDNAWQSTAVSEVNKFHNHFIGVADEIYNEGDVVAVQRGNSGIVLVNVGDGSDISVTTKGMKDGTYTDSVSGNTFTVKNGVISGKLGDSGIAVVYEGSATTPKASFSVADKTVFRKDTMSLTITLDNAVSGTYSINGSTPVTFKNSVDIAIGEGIAYGTDVAVKVTATDGKKTIETTQTYYKEQSSGTGVFVYFDNSPYKWKDVLVYAFYEEVNSDGSKTMIANNGNWPGVPMDIDEETGYYYYELPADLPVGKACVIIGNGQDQTNDLRVEYPVMIFKDRAFKQYDPNGTTLVYGDLDNDGDVSSADALMVLRATVGLEKLTEAQQIQADVDGDETVSSVDALFILRAVVGFNDNNNVGKEFVYNGYVDNGGNDSDIKNVFYIVDKAGWLFNDGCKLWVENSDTKEIIETIKESPFDNSSTYAYFDLPSGWTNINVYRTDPYANDISAAYDSWKCGTIKEGTNAVSIGDSKVRFVSFNPEA